MFVDDLRPNGDRCRATVTLHEPLRRSFGTWLGGKEVASAHRCRIQGAHHGEHLAAADSGGKDGWFRWDDSGVRVGGAEGSDRGRRTGLAGSPRHAASAAQSSGARSAVSTTNAAAPPPKAGRHASDATVPAWSPESRSPTEALWALTTALARLADVIAAALGAFTGSVSTKTTGSTGFSESGSTENLVMPLAVRADLGVGRPATPTHQPHPAGVEGRRRSILRFRLA